MRKLAPLFCILAALPLLLGSDVYRWVDNSGVVNYTQQKPQGVNAVLISSTGRVRAAKQADTPAATAIPAPASGAPKLSPEQQKMLADLKVAEAERQVAYTNARTDNCKRARRVLQRLSSNGRIRVRGENGAQQVLPEEERQQRISEAQLGITENCS